MRLFFAGLAWLLLNSFASAEPLRIVALGDSLTAGLGLPAAEAFPSRLEAALKAKGHDVTVVNAGVSGDTAAQGLARLDWALADGADAVIVELGANDMLRGVDPAATRATLNEIVSKIEARGAKVLIAGMYAAPNLGPGYTNAFNGMFPDLAREHQTLLYPFFMDGLIGVPGMVQADGEHPTAAGSEEIARRMLPLVEELIGQINKTG
ncbi:arylesterase [Oryzibacter oryziterrae]|uniref:arylesterase n=1 Tax=Oryzibacter oryziterrae TaxID=2766474 RepID=UPI001F3B9BF5|nr:arylesterase [Oryzibacter oryziterrae]